MKFKELNYYGFDHKAVPDHFSGELEYICEMSLPLDSNNGVIDIPCAVYKANKPDYGVGHKDYMLLFSSGDTLMVSGKSEEEMSKLWLVPGIHCTACGDVLISISRHHFNQCNCENESFIDGGTDYQRIGGMKMSLIENVLIDMRTKEIKQLTS